MLGILAVVFGFVGRGRVKRGEADNRRGANADITTGIVAIVLAGGLIALGVSALKRLGWQESPGLPEERARRQGRDQSVQHPT